MHKPRRTIKYLIYLLALVFYILISAGNVCASMRAQLNFAIFNSPNKGPYIECYLAIDGSSVSFVPAGESGYQATVEITMIFMREHQVFEYDKYLLKSGMLHDSLGEGVTIIDQQRYFLPEGEYEYHITMVDRNSPSDTVKSVQLIEIDFPDDEVNFSAIQLIDSIRDAKNENILTKSGYDLFPKVVNYYSKDDRKLMFYTEIYNTLPYLGESGRFLLKSYIKTFESDYVIDDYVAYKRAEAREVYPYLREFDISSLPSGNYILTVELRDEKNEVISTNSLFFARNNPDVSFEIDRLQAYELSGTFVEGMTSPDTLDEYIKSLAPAATNFEKQFIYRDLENTDLTGKQRFLYYFWYMRNREDPEGSWLRYREMVNEVERRFSTQIHKGYETDRGRVYLKYGPPNIVTESYNEPSSYPYEIWQYYQLGNNQRNKRFVFYSHDEITNNFELLHSDAIGELSNYRWQVILNSRWYDPYNVDITRPPHIWGSNAEDYYRDPR